MPTIYETSAELPSFGGINQQSSGYNMSLRFAQTAYNADVTGGSLAPMRKGAKLPQTIDKPIETLARLHRRYHTDEHDLLVAIADGCLYTKALDREDDWTLRYTGLQNSKCDFVTYEINRQGSDAPTDVLLFSNAYDGMFCLYGDTLEIASVPTPKKFGCIARFKERIWGSGIIGDPDMLVYSAPYNPFNWEENKEIPEDGAGDILQPSWDGDSFLALKPLGSFLLAFKRNTIWKVYGTNPGDFVMSEQYGAGTIAEGTVCVSNAYAYMLGWGGIERYDGSESVPFQQEVIRDITTRINENAAVQACAVMNGKQMHLALPLDDSPINNAIVSYNVTEKSWSCITGVNVKSFLSFDDRVFYTDALEPSTVYELGSGECLPVVWVSGFQDLGAKDVVKSNFSLYFTVNAEQAFVPLTLRIRTEKKVKEKYVLVEAGKSKRVNINASGRYFRVEIVCKAKFHWSIDGGITIHCELDPD